MKIAIVGCGAIGGYVGAKLALAGEAVTVLARGATLEAVRARGITLHMNARRSPAGCRSCTARRRSS